MKPTLLRQMDMGSLTCAQIWVCHTLEDGGGGGGGGQVAQELTRRDIKKTVPHPEPPGDRTQGLRI